MGPCLPEDPDSGLGEESHPSSAAAPRQPPPRSSPGRACRPSPAAPQGPRGPALPAGGGGRKGPAPGAAAALVSPAPWPRAPPAQPSTGSVGMRVRGLHQALPGSSEGRGAGAGGGVTPRTRRNSGSGPSAGGCSAQSLEQGLPSRPLPHQPPLACGLGSRPGLGRPTSAPHLASL